MFVMVFVVETIRISVIGSIVFFCFFFFSREIKGHLSVLKDTPFHDYVS